MTDALDQAGVARGAKVTEVAFEGLVGTGQLSRNARFRLVWDDPGGRPSTVIGKFPCDDPNLRAGLFQSGLYKAEFVFYDRVRSTVGIRVPHCWAARYDESARRFVLVMEDLCDSRQGDQFAGCTLDEVALAVEQAVALHAPRWGDPTVAELSALIRPDASSDQLVASYRRCVDGCLDRLGHALHNDAVDLVERFGPVVDCWAKMDSGTPHTFVHGDFRPDNFLFGNTTAAPPLAVVDWQTIFEGLGVTDVAYLLGGVFTPKERSAVEYDLLEDYRRRLALAGVTYSVEDCRRDYRWASLYGVVIGVTATVMAERTDRGDQLFTLMLNRHASHALDLGALDVLGA
jgi:hypothetical protein